MNKVFIYTTFPLIFEFHFNPVYTLPERSEKQATVTILAITVS